MLAFSLNSDSHQAINFFADEIKGTSSEKALTYHFDIRCQQRFTLKKLQNILGSQRLTIRISQAQLGVYPDLIIHRLLHLYPSDHSNRTKDE